MTDDTMYAIGVLIFILIVIWSLTCDDGDWGGWA